MQLVIKEILDHLRAALDYCARQVWEEVSGTPTDAKVYFPIAREGAKAVDFASPMNLRVPGVPAASPGALAAFAAMQGFADPANAWLPELATLANFAKHEHLRVASVPGAFLRMGRDRAGRAWASFEAGGGPRRFTPWMSLVPRPDRDADLATFEARHLAFAETNVDVPHYLQQALAGVGRAIERSRAVLGGADR